MAKKRSSKQKLFETMGYVNPDFHTKKIKQTFLKEWGESGYYPPGAEHDPAAPWNQGPDLEYADEWTIDNWDADLYNIGVTFHSDNSIKGYPEATIETSLGEILEPWTGTPEGDYLFDQLEQGVKNPASQNDQAFMQRVEAAIKRYSDEYVSKGDNWNYQENEPDYPEREDFEER